jgi:hypothetical protein
VGAQRDSHRSTAKLVAVALALSVVSAVELVAGNGFGAALLRGDLGWEAIVCTLAMVAFGTGAVTAGFATSMRPTPTRLAATAAGGALALVAGLEAIHQGNGVSTQLLFTTSVLAQALFAWSAVQIALSKMRLAGAWTVHPARAAFALPLAVGAVGFVGQAWVPLATSVRWVALARDLGVTGATIATLVVVTFYRPLRLDLRSHAQSLLLRLPVGDEGRVRRRALLLLVVGSAASFAAWTGVFVAAREAAPLTCIPLGWLGFAALVFSDLAGLTGDLRQGAVAARLAPLSARRFLKRHLPEGASWAATVGLRTANFVIDHDPDGLLSAALPASVNQIRSAEIQRAVGEVLGEIYLQGYVVGHRTFGAIDPEASLRPCIDALKLFACLYLDAGPLVERRIKGLTALTPIVDPQLAQVLGGRDIEAMIRRNHWFFHFDFGWIDQHVVHTPRDTRYEVRLATLPSRIRQVMMDHLAKTGGVGNFVWLGPTARERLLQEAPGLRNIVETCPLRSPDGKDEQLMFMIKFEQLIPRLQRYFDLDSMRTGLLDFEPTGEALRLVNLLELQISRAEGETELLDALRAIASVPWRGFKEKDHALHLILAVFRAIEEETGLALGVSGEPRARALHDEILDAVKAIGYPTQILHLAQINKNALRDVDLLKRVASHPDHPRFAEAWLLLATTDYRARPEPWRNAVLAFLGEATRSPRLARVKLAQTKAVDAWASLGRALGPSESSEATISRTGSDLARWFATQRVDADACCLLLDAHAFLAEAFSRDRLFDADATAALGRYVTQLAEDLGHASPWVVAILGRWQDLSRTAEAPQLAGERSGRAA